MTLLSAADIADLTALDVSGMPDTCSITTVTYTSDGGGGQIETPTTTTSICRFAPRTGREVGGAQLDEIGAYALYVPKTTPIPNTARVTINGRAFQVVFTPPVSVWSTSRMVGLQDVAS